MTSRYDDFKNAAGMALVADVPQGSTGKASMKLTAGGSGPRDATFFRLRSSGRGPSICISAGRQHWMRGCWLPLWSNFV